MTAQGGMDGFQMELNEKMLATWCACMPVRLGADACHISGDGWAITNASSPTCGGKHQGFGGGGVIGATHRRNCVSSEMG
jgi:hypothetical protein